MPFGNTQLSIKDTTSAFMSQTRLSIPALTVCTGRIRTFIEQPELCTMAPSCTVYVYDNDLEDCLLFCDRALRGGAGVKVQLEKFIARQPIQFNWGFDLSPLHSDYPLIHKSDKETIELYTPVYRFQYEAPTIISVADSMEEGDYLGRLSIRNSWLKFIELALQGKEIIVDLSALRPAGKENEVGLVATGPLGYGDGDGSFLSIYQRIATHLRVGDMISLMHLLGQLNRVLRRGGTYKNGIICTGLDYRHADIEKYLNSDLSDLPGGQKKAVRVDEGILADKPLCNLIVERINRRGFFLEKIQSSALYSNVCEEILIKHRGVCLLSHANAAACNSPIELIDALVETTKFVIALHLSWREQVGDKANVYLPIEDDKQIGVGWCGWANFLRRMSVSYRQHVEALEACLESKPYHDNAVASEIAHCLVHAYHKATVEADSLMVGAGKEILERIWTMAPCQRNWVDYQDPDGFVLCRSIDPPFSQVEKRDSHTDINSVGRYNHGPVETMLEVGHDLHQRHWEAWQRMMSLTCRSHTMSFDLWKKVDLDWFEDFVQRSPLQTTYYQFADDLDQQYLNKGQIWEAVEACDLDECISCAE